MAYDDIRISELPSLPELHANDLILVQDVTNNLAHRIDWGRLKNSIGTLSKGITFPLGTEQQPEIAIGDHTSGIMAEDYGTFVIVTHGEKRFKINQAGTIELINGNVVIGNFDRQCTYALIVNNITTFNCYASFTSGADIDGNLNVTGNITGGKKFNVPGDVILGTDCENSLVVNGEIFGKCNMDLKGNMAIHKSLTVDESATILSNVSIGSSCVDKFDVYSNAWFRCDLRVDGDLSFGGDLILDGDVNIGGGCSNQINLNGTTTVYCDLRVKGEAYLEQNLYVNNNAAIDGNLFAKEDTILGIGCQYTTTINSALTVECTSFFRGDVTIGDPSLGCPGTHLQVNGNAETQCDVLVHQDLVVDHNTTLGTDCNDDLLVKATPVFLCDAEFRKTVNITDNLFVGGDFTADSHLVEIGDNRGCVNPNIINLNGEVHIECDLYVSGTVLYDGDLQITGPNITIGAGCGNSNINLQGYTIAHCDMLIKGDVAPYALTVTGNTEIQSNLEVRGTFDVAGDSAHDANIFVHLDSFLNLPVPAHEYWEQCECINEVIATRPNRDPAQYTFIHGTQKSLCQVYLNDPRWYKSNNADPHVQETEIYGSLFARANVVLNSGQAKSSTTNCLQLTSIKGRLIQDCTVVLNDTIESSNNMGFNQTPNEEKTIIKGDTRILHNLEVGSNCNELTRINNKFEVRCDTHLNENVDLNGGANGTTKTCATKTNIWGSLIQHCTSILGDVCADHITLNGATSIINGVNLSNGYGASSVTNGDLGFFTSGGAECSRNSYQYAVTSAVSASSQGGTTTPIQITVNTKNNNAGDISIAGAAGNGKFDVGVSGGLLTGSGSMTANQDGGSSVTIGLTESAICGVMKPLTPGTGLNGSYDPCSGGTISFDPSVLPDPCDKMKPLTINVSGEGSGGGTYDPCAGGTIDIIIDTQDGGGSTGGGGDCKGKVVIKQGGTKKGEFNICGSSQTIDLDAGGTGSPGSGKLVIVAGDGLTLKHKGSNKNFNANQPTGKDVEWTLDVDPAGCPSWTEGISAKRLSLIESGGANNPGIVLGTKQAANSGKAWLGISSNQNNGSFTCHRGTKGWKEDQCGGSPKGDSDKLFSVAAGTSVLPHHASAGLIAQGGADNESVDCFKYGTNDNTDGNSTGINGGAPEGREYNRFCFKKTTFRRGRIQEIDRSGDSRVNIDIDATVASLGISDDPNTPDGLFRWGLKAMDEYDGHKYPFLFIDPDELGARLPGLVDWTPKASAWELERQFDEDGNEIDYDFKLKDTFDPATELEAGKFNQNAMFALSFAGLNRARKRLDDLNITNEEGTTTLQAPVKFEDIIKIDLDSLRHAEDDEEAANMGVFLGQVYRNGSQLMVRVT